MAKTRKRKAREAEPRPRPRSKPPGQRPPATMSQAEYARHKAVSREAVNKAIRQGRIPVNRNGRISVDTADAAWEANTARPKGAEPPPLPLTLSNGQPLTYANARAMHEYFKAELAKLDLGERSGELVRMSDVRDVAFRASRSARDLLDSIPDRLSEVLAGLTDPEDVRRTLTEEIQRATSELSMTELSAPDQAGAS